MDQRYQSSRASRNSCFSSSTHSNLKLFRSSTLRATTVLSFTEVSKAALCRQRADSVIKK